MNTDFPPSDPRAELEATLTALLVGELPHEEAAALHQKLAQDPELAQLYERLKHTINLVRETVTTPAEQPAAQPAPLKLSHPRRQKLLQHFKTVRPKEFVRPRRREMSWLLPVAAVVAFVALLGALLMPALSRGKSRSLAMWGFSSDEATAGSAAPAASQGGYKTLGPGSSETAQQASREERARASYSAKGADSAKANTHEAQAFRLSKGGAPAKGLPQIGVAGSSIVLPKATELAFAPLAVTDGGKPWSDSATLRGDGFSAGGGGGSGQSSGSARGGAAVTEGRQTEAAGADDFFDQANRSTSLGVVTSPDAGAAPAQDALRKSDNLNLAFSVSPGLVAGGPRAESKPAPAFNEFQLKPGATANRSLHLNRNPEAPAATPAPSTAVAENHGFPAGQAVPGTTTFTGVDDVSARWSRPLAEGQAASSLQNKLPGVVPQEIALNAVVPNTTEQLSTGYALSEPQISLQGGTAPSFAGRGRFGGKKADQSSLQADDLSLNPRPQVLDAFTAGGRLSVAADEKAVKERLGEVPAVPELAASGKPLSPTGGFSYGLEPRQAGAASEAVGRSTATTDFSGAAANGDNLKYAWHYDALAQPAPANSGGDKVPILGDTPALGRFYRVAPGAVGGGRPANAGVPATPLARGEPAAAAGNFTWGTFDASVAKPNVTEGDGRQSYFGQLPPQDGKKVADGALRLLNEGEVKSMELTDYDGEQQKSGAKGQTGQPTTHGVYNANEFGYLSAPLIDFAPTPAKSATVERYSISDNLAELGTEAERLSRAGKDSIALLSGPEPSVAQNKRSGEAVDLFAKANKPSPIFLPATPDGVIAGRDAGRDIELRRGVAVAGTTPQSGKGGVEGKPAQQMAEGRRGVQQNQGQISGSILNGDVPATLLSAETLRRVQGHAVETKAEVARQEATLERLKDMSRAQQIQAIPTGVGDSLLSSLLEQRTLVEQKLALAKKDAAPDKGEVARLQSTLGDLNKKAEERAAGVVLNLEAKVQSSKQNLTALEWEVETATNQDAEKAAKSRPYFEAKHKLDELERFGQILSQKIASENTDLTLPKSTMVEIVEKAAPRPAERPNLLARVFGGAGGGSESTARIRVERDQADLASLQGPTAVAGYDPYFIQTEFEAMRSEAVLGKVIKDLKLNEAWGKKQGGRALTTAETMALLKNKLTLRPVGNTSLVDVGVKSEQPAEAANIANAVAQAYKTYRNEQREALTKGGIAALERGWQEAQQKIAAAKSEVERLQSAATNQQADVAPPKPPASAPIPQPEVPTAENAYSTFSLNVSDVSFKLVAASLEKGVMPDPANVRSEEFINAFDYRDPEPPPGVPVAFAWERAQYPFTQNRDLLRFSIKTAALGRQPGRPLNLVLLLDNSGSMERADRVKIIREALRVLAGQLQPQDVLSVVTFSRTAQLRVDGVPGSQAAQVVEEVSGLTPEGGTNLEDAMNLAYQTALRHYLASGVNRVVLLTDGAANLGDVEPEALKQKVETNRKQGIALDCFGIGWEGYNDDLLEVLSRNGDGRYGFINTPEEAATEFAGQLAGALHVAASDVKVQVEFNPARVTAYRQMGYAKHQLTKEQFRDNTVDAAEIGAAEAGNALYAVEVNPGGTGPLCTVRVRYKVPGTSDYHEHEWPVPYTGNAVALEQASPAMRLAASANAFAEWLVTSPYATEVTPDRLLGLLNGVPEVYGADARPKKLEWMVRQAKSIAGK